MGWALKASQSIPTKSSNAKPGVLQALIGYQGLDIKDTYWNHWCILVPWETSVRWLKCQELALQSLDVPHHKISSSLGPRRTKAERHKRNSIAMYCYVLRTHHSTMILWQYRPCIDSLTIWLSDHLGISLSLSASKLFRWNLWMI